MSPIGKNASRDSSAGAAKPERVSPRRRFGHRPTRRFNQLVPTNTEIRLRRAAGGLLRRAGRAFFVSRAARPKAANRRAQLAKCSSDQFKRAPMKARLA